MSASTPPRKPTTAPAPRGRTRLSAEDRREQLLDVAAEVVRTDGVRALTMERLAARARVSKGLGYAYFENVAELALALWDREVAAVYRHVEQATAGATGFEDVSARAIRAYFDVLHDRGDLLAVLQASLQHGRAERRIGRRVREFVRFWEDRLAASAGLRDETATAAAAMLPAAVDACARLWRLGRISRADAERVAHAFALSGVRGLAGARTAPAARHMTRVRPLQDPTATDVGGATRRRSVRRVERGPRPSDRDRRQTAHAAAPRRRPRT